MLRWWTLVLLSSLSNACFATPLYHEEDNFFTSLQCNCTRTESGPTAAINIDCTSKNIYYLKNGQTQNNGYHKHIKRHENDRFGRSEYIRFDVRHNLLSKITDEFHEIQTYQARLIKYLYLSYNRLRSINVDSFTTLLNLHSLFLDHNQLQFIPNLGLLINLKDLDISYNTAIKELSARFLPTSLEKLSIAGVGIKRITSSYFNGLTMLHHLDMSDGIGTGIRKRQIEDGAFNDLNNLTVLDISYTLWEDNISSEKLWKNLTKLEKLNARRCYMKEPLQIYNSTTKALFSKNLAVLDFSGNRIDSQNLTKLSFLNLKMFYLNNTKLADVQSSFQNMPRLIELHLSRVGITNGKDLDLQHLQSLRYLDISFNRLQSSPVIPASLENINLFGNQLGTIKKNAFSHMQHITTLNLKGQGTSTIEELAFYSSGNKNLLQHLYLDNNKLTQINASSFLGLDNLLKLTLAGNHITRVVGALPLPSLQFLDLSNNDIIYLFPNVFGEIKNLRHLDLSKNFQLVDLQFNRPMMQLTMLNLNDCNFTWIPDLSIFPALQTLNLSNNFIEHVTASNFNNCCQNLSTLILDRNLIEIGPQPVFSNLTNLKVFDLSENSANISVHAFKNLDHLVTLKLRNNDMDEFFNISFPNLEILDMGQNKLKTLGTIPLNELMPKVKQIDLNSNTISHIQDGLLDGMENLTFIDFKYNAFKCPCNETSEEFQSYLYVKAWLTNFANMEKADPRMDIKPNILSLFTYYCIRHNENDIINLFDTFTCDEAYYDYENMLNMTDSSYYPLYGY